MAGNQKHKHVSKVTGLKSRMASSGMLRCLALLRTDVSVELSGSIIRVTRLGELGTKLAVTSNRRTLVFLCFDIILLRAFFRLVI
jgi:hypothetical protein